MNHWIIKSEPTTYPWAQLIADGNTPWDGVRSYQARNNLQAMQQGDLCLFYHSNEGREIVGIAQITHAAYPDPTDPKWVVVEVAPVRALPRPITLAQIKTDPNLQNIALVRQSRLSVIPITAAEYDYILHLSAL
jgi:predicted RNA-binding protein with PUA-like domain